MSRQVSFAEGLELTRKSGLFSEEELHLVATGHALDVLMHLVETPPAETPAPPAKPES